MYTKKKNSSINKIYDTNLHNRTVKRSTKRTKKGILNANNTYANIKGGSLKNVIGAVTDDMTQNTNTKLSEAEHSNISLSNGILYPLSIQNTIDFTDKQKKLTQVLEILASKEKKFIIIDGSIGSGKTTLIGLIEQKNKYKNLKAILEPVDVWEADGALKYFYEDMKQNTYAFQTYTVSTRINRIIDTICANQYANIFILERSIWTDYYIFMKTALPNLNNVQMIMYKKLFDMWAYMLPMRIDKWVLLNTSVETCDKRISARGRNAENKIGLPYLNELYKIQNDFYDNLSTDGLNAVKIDNTLMSENFITDDTVLNEIEKIILKDL